MCPFQQRFYAILMCGFALSSTPVFADFRDTGTSLNLLLKYSIDKDWFLLSRSNLASRNDNEDFFFGYVGASLGRNLNDTWSIRLGYRRAWIKLQDTWLEEDRPFVEAYATDTLDGFRLTNRTRVEWRLFDYRDDDIRLRNEITVQAPWKLTALQLQPYLEEEFFYSTDAEQFEANWLGGGLAWRVAGGVKFKAGYRWNHFRIGDKWHDRDTLVLGLNLFF